MAEEINRVDQDEDESDETLIRKIDPKKDLLQQLATIWGVPELATTPKPETRQLKVSEKHIVRLFVPGRTEKNKGKMVLVLHPPKRGGGTRAAGQGVPGGKLEPGETLLQATSRDREGGELKWAILSVTYMGTTGPVRKKDRQEPGAYIDEYTHVFRVDVDEENEVSITKAETPGTVNAEFFEFSYICEMEEVNTQDGAPEDPEVAKKIYHSHKMLAKWAWELNEKMVAAGELPA